MYVKKFEYARTVARNKELEEQNEAQCYVIKNLLKENKKLKEDNDLYYKRTAKLLRENELLREELVPLEYDYKQAERDCYSYGNENAELKKEIKKLKEELRKYKKLHKYSNGELLTYSGE